MMCMCSKYIFSPSRNASRILPFFFLLLIFTACSKEDPIKLGFVGGLSGRVADLGISGRNGAILAVEHWNNNGGVRGRPVNLVVMDDEQKPERYCERRLPPHAA